MSNRPEPLNAVLYGQYHLKGGLRHTLLGMGITLAIFVALFGVALSSDAKHPAEVAKAAVYMLPAIQLLVLGLYGASRVAAAVRQDVALGLIESHRLTPTPPLAAAIGYVLGPPVQALAIAATLFVCGCGTCLMADVPITYWLVSNAMALVLSLSLYVITALIGFTFASGAAMPIIMIGSLVSSTLFLVVPALAVLTSPLLGQTLFNLIGSRTAGVPPAYGFAVVGHVLLGGVLLIAVARRYRNADTPAFTIRLGTLLLFLWTAVTLVGMIEAPLFVPRGFGRRDDTISVTQLVAAVLSSLLIALVPLGAVARRLGRMTGDDTHRPVGMAVAVAVLACVALCVVPAVVYDLFASPGVDWPRLGGTTAMVAATALGATFTLAWQHLAGRPGRAWLFLFLALPNALPPMLGAVLAMNQPMGSSAFAPLVSLSPIASLVMLWDDRPGVALPGLAFQAVLVLLPLGLYASRLRGMTAAPQGFPVELTTRPTPAE